MKRNILITLLVAAIACGGIGAVRAINTKIASSEDNSRLSKIEGTVLEVNPNSILINESGYENGECYLLVSDDTEICIGDEKADISKIKIGQTVLATYTGGVEEIYPGNIDKVTKITVLK